MTDGTEKKKTGDNKTRYYHLFLSAHSLLKQFHESQRVTERRRKTKQEMVGATIWGITHHALWKLTCLCLAIRANIGAVVSIPILADSTVNDWRIMCAENIDLFRTAPRSNVPVIRGPRTRRSRRFRRRRSRKMSGRCRWASKSVWNRGPVANSRTWGRRMGRWGSKVANKSTPRPWGPTRWTIGTRRWPRRLPIPKTSIREDIVARQRTKANAKTRDTKCRRHWNRSVHFRFPGPGRRRKCMDWSWRCGNSCPVYCGSAQRLLRPGTRWNGSRAGSCPSGHPYWLSNCPFASFLAPSRRHYVFSPTQNVIECDASAGRNLHAAGWRHRPQESSDHCLAVPNVNNEDWISRPRSAACTRHVLYSPRPSGNESVPVSARSTVAPEMRSRLSFRTDGDGLIERQEDKTADRDDDKRATGHDACTAATEDICVNIYEWSHTCVTKPTPTHNTKGPA